MKIVATLERADGNESVGSMWSETALFDSSTPVAEIMQWASDREYYYQKEKPPWKEYLALNIRLSLAQEPQADNG